MANDRTEAPALAYYDMAELLGEAYFLTQPPTNGLSITVFHMGDQSSVSFDMDAGTWARVQEQLKTDPHTNLRFVGVTQYRKR